MSNARLHPTFSIELQPPALPLIHEQDKDHFPRDKFLFQSFPNDQLEAEISELYAKIRLIKSLIKEYSDLAEDDKAKIKSIQEYLVRFLTLAKQSIESSHSTENRMTIATLRYS